MRSKMIEDLWTIRNRALRERYKYRQDAIWTKAIRKKLAEFEVQVESACAAGVTTDSERTVWSFWGSMFFSSTVITTIGKKEFIFA